MAPLSDRFSAALPWMELRLWPGLGERGLARLREQLGDANTILRMLPSDPEREQRRHQALAALVRADQLDARVLTFSDDRYPERLRHLTDPPPVLFGLGRVDLLQRVGVAIVGSRSATEYGRRVAARLAAALVARGLPVVSGLARGIDSAAHRGALDAGGPTVAVVGGGLGVPPGSRKRLFAEIAADGLVLSEFLPDEHPRPHHFPKRNRVLAALSAAVVVVEAGERSGAHITVRHGLDLGLTIWAVPGPIDRENSGGCLRLIRDGARVVVGVEEAADSIAEEVAVETGRAPSGPRVPPLFTTASESGSPGPAGGDDDRLLEALGAEPTSLEEVVRASGLGVGEVSRRVLRLELSGRIRQLPGQRFVRAGS